jgi:hypothetical protein
MKGPNFRDVLNLETPFGFSIVASVIVAAIAQQQTLNTELLPSNS